MTYEADIQPIIRLDSFHLSRLDFNIDESLWQKYELEETQFKMDFTQLLQDDRENYFGVLFNVIILNPDESISLNFDFVGHFEVKNIKIDDEALASVLFKSSAPAIVFPYVRAFVSNLTINAGFKPIILPAINFHSVKKVNKEEPQ